MLREIFIRSDYWGTTWSPLSDNGFLRSFLSNDGRRPSGQDLYFSFCSIIIIVITIIAVDTVNIIAVIMI